MAVILIVCTANICRSPVVMALLDERLRDRADQQWLVTSAGTWANSGNKAAEYSVLIMGEQGLNIGDHRSQPVSRELMNESDLVLTMEVGHAEALRAEYIQEARKVFTLSEMSGKPKSVRDPYGGPRRDYERMVAEVTNLVDEGLPKIIELASANAAGRSADQKS